MRRLIFIAVIAVTYAFIITPAKADYYGGRVYWDRINGYYDGNGGEFTFRSDGGPGLLLSNVAYDDRTSGLGGWNESFQTFCLERVEYVYSGQPLDIVVSETFVDGTSGSHAVLGGMANGDDLDPMTAYLYTQFAKGILSDYNYVSGAGRIASAGALQNAIWYIEGELTTLATGQATDWYNEAWEATNLGSDNLITWIGIGDVRVLNTWVIDHINNLDYARQDMLYLVPIPAAILLGILGSGVAGIKLRKYI